MYVDPWTFAGLLVGATCAGFMAGAAVLVGVALRMLRYRAEEVRRAVAGK